jgi:anion-transporting  ArsA/GET3 family ATPase
VSPGKKSPPAKSSRSRKPQAAGPGSKLLARRMVFVTGKGGVGKTTVAGALALTAARTGMRTLVCELDARERMGQLFGSATGTFEETEVAPDLSAITIDPQKSMEEYLLLQIKVRPVYDLLFKNRVFEYFAAATPGLSELVTIGKVWELAQPDRLTKGAGAYDIVIVDAPATGHGLAMLEAPTTFQRIARVGPIHRQAGRISSFLHDGAQMSIVAVATAEEMPVNETGTLQDELKKRVGLKLDMVFANMIEPEVFKAAEIDPLRSVADSPPVEAAIMQYERYAMQQEQLARLRKSVKVDVVELPFLYEKAVGRAELEQLSDALMERLKLEPRAAENGD